jgi:TonB family protein
MPATQIPPVGTTPSVPPPRRRDDAELYDNSEWESLFVELHEAPNLLVKLQDDLSDSRRREAFWISVAVHLFIVLLLVNSDKLVRLMPRRAVVVATPYLSNQKDLTFLELPPDEQKLTQRPKSNIISDKDRQAMSKSPQLNREELKKILDASRAGRPGPVAPPSPQQQPAPAAPPQGNQTPQPQQQAAPPPPPDQNLSAKLQLPPPPAAKPNFNNALSPGSAIAQAEQAAAANRGGYAGDNGDYGLGGRQPTARMGPMDVLSDTMGVDFGPYLARVLQDVKMNWYNLIPESARAPIMKKGKVSIEFAILKNGQIAGMKLNETSGDVALDRGAWGGITASNPFPPLPAEFGGQYLALRFHFFYNPDKKDLQ